MFSCLRHYAFVSCDHQRDGVDAVCAGQHVLNESLVPRDVDEPDLNVAEIQIGKADIDSNSAPFFFGQPVGVNACERAYEGRLAMIDVTCRADDD